MIVAKRGAQAATHTPGMLQLLLPLGAPAREAVGSVEASALLPLACEGEVRLTPSQWLERWKSQHAGTGTFKPASQPGLLPRPRVPRLVMQTARNTTEALLHYSAWMATWIQLNPEYDYGARLPCMSTSPPPHLPAHSDCLLDVAVLLDDAACADFIDRFCSDDERLGYASLLTGASRSDLFRLFWLRELGGVYADLDAELTLPLREMLPLNASMLAPYGFEPEFQHGQSAVLVVPQLTTLASWG